MSSLPDSWVDALFAKFRLTWGAQKFSSAYRPIEGENVTDWAEELHNIWAAQLGGFSGRTLKLALQAAIDSGREWPPTLAEFKALCRQYNRPEHEVSRVPALTNGGSGRGSDVARENLERIKAMLSGAVKVMP